MPSTGLELENAFQSRSRARSIAVSQVYRIHLGILGKHVITHIVHDLNTFEVRVDLKGLLKLLDDQRPRVIKHAPDVSIMKMTYSESTGMPPMVWSSSTR